MWLTLALPLIQMLVPVVEQLFGPKTGATKLDTVVKAIQPVLANLATAGKLGSPPPAVHDIAAEVSKIAAKLFPSGTTVNPNPPIPTVPDTTVVAPPIVSDDLKKSLRSLLIWALTE